jgi:hypothetical protein
MAYPTNFAFRPVNPGAIGLYGPGLWAASQGSGNGAQPSLAGTLQVDTTQQAPLGSVRKFLDASGTYGEIEAIYLKGVASTVAGSVVSYDPNLATTTLAVAATRGPLAVALCACVAGNYGWYAVQGQVPVSTASAGTGAANSGLKVTSTAGQATVAAGVTAGDIQNAICKSAQDAPGTGFTNVEIAYPYAMV